MLTREEFRALLAEGPLILDGATGSNLQKAGMPRGCCTEEWILANPEPLVALQRAYAKAGSRVVYAPTFQAQPIALARVKLHKPTEAVNAHLVALSHSAAPDCLIAGDLTTLAAFMDSFDAANFDCLVENYRVQIAGLLEGGADLLAAETLMYPLEAEAILTAAELEEAGAAAVGFNCVAADDFTPGLVSKLRRYVKGALVCKPNAGVPVIGEDGLAHYGMEPGDFARTVSQCRNMGASILGGCCGTDPEYITALKASLA